MLHNISSLQEYGNSPLHIAALSGHETVVAVLLSEGDNVNQANKKSQSPLHWAAAYGHEAVVTLLLTHGADANQADNDGQSPLLRAAVNCRTVVVALLLSKGGNANQADSTGFSPLHRAAANGYEAVVAVLLSKGANADQADNKGQKPIDVADTQKIKDIFFAHAKEKQERGGEELAEQQQPPNNEATSNGQAVSTLVDKSQWFQAAEQGDLALIHQGIKDKIDVNCQDSKGCTAVYLAAKEGHLGLVEYLISQQADLHIVDNVSDDDVVSSTTALTPLSPTLVPVHRAARLLAFCTITDLFGFSSRIFHLMTSKMNHDHRDGHFVCHFFHCDTMISSVTKITGQQSRLLLEKMVVQKCLVTKNIVLR